MLTDYLDATGVPREFQPDLLQGAAWLVRCLSDGVTLVISHAEGLMLSQVNMFHLGSLTDQSIVCRTFWPMFVVATGALLSPSSFIM